MSESDLLYTVDGEEMPDYVVPGNLSAFCPWCGAIQGAGDLHLVKCPWRILRASAGLS